jgi:hypothetical protein
MIVIPTFHQFKSKILCAMFIVNHIPSQETLDTHEKTKKKKMHERINLNLMLVNNIIQTHVEFSNRQR